MTKHSRKTASGPWLSGRTYDFMKFLAQILIPALGTLYFALAQIWGLPAAEEVVGTVVAVDTFLGVILGISTAQYNASESRFDGIMEVHPKQENGVQTFQLNLNEAPEYLADKSIVAFRVQTIVPEVPQAQPGELPHVPPMQ